MTTGIPQDLSAPARRRESVNTAVGIAAERATVAERERTLEQARAAARRLTATTR
jgi:hypothetical protein